MKRGFAHEVRGDGGLLLPEALEVRRELGQAVATQAEDAAKPSLVDSLAGVIEMLGGGAAPPFSPSKEDGIEVAALDLVRNDAWRLKFVVGRQPDHVLPVDPELAALWGIERVIPGRWTAFAIIERDGQAPKTFCGGKDAADALRSVCRKPIIAAVMPLFCIQLAPEPT